MRVLYLDCGMGAAGDMLSAALLELLPEEERGAFVEEVNALGIPGVHVEAEPAEKCGIRGTHMRVTVHGEEEHSHDHHEHHHHHDHDHEHEHEHDEEHEHGHFHHHHDHDHEHEHEHDEEHEHGHFHHHHDHDHEHEHEHDEEHEHGHFHHHHEHEHEHEHEEEHGHHHHGHGHHHHSGMHDIEHIVTGHLDLPEAVKKDVMAVYGLIAEAESQAHGVPVEQIHFHEVGTMDAVADIVMTCLLIRKLAPDRIAASPVHVGCGKVRCAHGILPVPAPATAYILKDVPIYGGRIEGELCTPTGAALLKHFVSEFGGMPVMRASAVGYGMGQKDFPAANCVRAMLGEDDSSADRVTELACNVDDMTGEEIGFALEQLLEAGALDVWTQAIGMKKSRPGVMISVLCREEKRAELTELLFKLTSTIGVRYQSLDRAVLQRSEEERLTPLGAVRVKKSSGHGVSREKAEYEDLARLAREKGVSLREMGRLLLE